MAEATTLMEKETLTQESDVSLSLPGSTRKTPLRTAVREFMRQYFLQLEQPQPTDLYKIVLAEMEIPLLEMTLQYCGRNQSQAAAKLLTISRGNLRQKMQQYGLLPAQQKIRKAD
jgi:Fis family transcriptional regulator, factor for inversion stimulation protein